MESKAVVPASEAPVLAELPVAKSVSKAEGTPEASAFKPAAILRVWRMEVALSDAVLPELAGLSVRQAISELNSCGLEVGQLKYVEDPYKNNVIDQSCKGKTVYAGQQIARGSVIDLVVGMGDGTGNSVVPFVIGKTRDKARRDILAVSLNVGREHFSGVKHRETAVVYRQEPDYTGVSRYAYGTEVELWYIDADKTDVAKMVREFKVDSSKIIDPNEIDDGRPSPEEIEDNSEWIW